MTSNQIGIDLNFRPKGYFWPLDLRTHVVSRVKGTIRRSEVSAAFDLGSEDTLPSAITQHELDPDLRGVIRGLGSPFCYRRLRFLVRQSGQLLGSAR